MFGENAKCAQHCGVSSTDDGRRSCARHSALATRCPITCRRLGFRSGCCKYVEQCKTAIYWDLALDFTLVRSMSIHRKTDRFLFFIFWLCEMIRYEEYLEYSIISIFALFFPLANCELDTSSGNSPEKFILLSFHALVFRNVRILEFDRCSDFWFYWK